MRAYIQAELIELFQHGGTGYGQLQTQLGIAVQVTPEPDGVLEQTLGVGEERAVDLGRRTHPGNRTP